MLPTSDQRTNTWLRWVDEHMQQLKWQLKQTVDLLGATQPEEVFRHGRSYLTLLNEAQHYPILTPSALNLIARLHPLPVRWGWGNLWETQLLFALKHTSAENTALRAEYYCGLADVYLPVGRFEEAIRQALIVRELTGVPLVVLARAVRTLFICFRSTGRYTLADELMDNSRDQFLGSLSADQVPLDTAQAWLIFNQSCLEQLREQGKIDEGLALLDQMIQLDQRQGSLNALLTADLVTQRSTLLWNRARYSESVADLTSAINYYQQGGARSMPSRSNPILVWFTGPWANWTWRTNPYLARFSTTAILLQNNWSPMILAIWG